MLQRAGPVLSCLDIQTRLVTVTGFCHRNTLKTFILKVDSLFHCLSTVICIFPSASEGCRSKKKPTCRLYFSDWGGFGVGIGVYVGVWDRVRVGVWEELTHRPGVSVRVGLGLGLEFDFLFFSPRKNWQCILRLLSRFSDVVRFCSLSLLFRTIIEQSSMCVLGWSGTFLFLIIFLNFWR